MGAPRIYPSLPGSTPFVVIWRGVFGSQNLPIPPRIYPPIQQIHMRDPPRIYPSLPEYTIPPPHFSTNIILCDIPRIYPSLPEYTPLSTNLCVRPSQNLPLFNNCMRPSQKSTPPSQNLPVPPRIYPPFQQLYETLPESNPPFSTNLYVRPS